MHIIDRYGYTLSLYIYIYIFQIVSIQNPLRRGFEIYVENICL